MKDKDELNIEKIVQKYGDMVYRIALVHGNTKEDAEDIFQEVFLRLTKHIQQLQGEEHVRNWLIRVTVNYGKTHKKKCSRHQTLPLDEQMITEEISSQSDMEWKVYAAVKSLPENYRTVIHLYYYEELSIKEISLCLKHKEGTIKSQLYRGRKLLGKKLGKEV